MECTENVHDSRLVVNLSNRAKSSLNFSRFDFTSEYTKKQSTHSWDLKKGVANGSSKTLGLAKF